MGRGKSRSSPTRVCLLLLKLYFLQQTVSLCLNANAELPVVGSILASTSPSNDFVLNNTDSRVTAQSFDEPENDVTDLEKDKNSSIPLLDTNPSMPLLQGNYLNSTDADSTPATEDLEPMDGNQRIANPCQSPLEWNSVRYLWCILTLVSTLMRLTSFHEDIVDVYRHDHPSKHARCFKCEFRFVDERSFGNPSERPQPWIFVTSDTNFRYLGQSPTHKGCTTGPNGSTP